MHIREFRAAEQEAARRIFHDGIMERIPNTAFRGLRQHPRTQLLYALLAGQCAPACRSPRLPGRAGGARTAPSARTGPPGVGGRGPGRPLARARARTRAPPAFCGGWGEVASSSGAAGLPAKARRAGRGNERGPGRRAGAAGVLACVPASRPPPGSSGWGRVTAGSTAAEAPSLARVTIFNPRGGGGCFAGSKC